MSISKHTRSVQQRKTSPRFKCAPCKWGAVDSKTLSPNKPAILSSSPLPPLGKTPAINIGSDYTAVPFPFPRSIEPRVSCGAREHSACMYRTLKLLQYSISPLLPTTAQVLFFYSFSVRERFNSPPSHGTIFPVKGHMRQRKTRPRRCPRSPAEADRSRTAVASDG